MRFTRSDLIRVLFDAQRRGDIPKADMRAFPPLAPLDLDPRHMTEVDSANRVIRVFVLSSVPRPELARAYFDAIARHLEGKWLLEVIAAHGDAAEHTAHIAQWWFEGPAEPVPARPVASSPLQPAIPA
ncbi:hypothetical protein AB0F17_43210 [Nonomuraea sp. NPDC026600]|uniref:hypothetical protein n=1 Tax=Nonomuraea sp. NPDC026600 TaxID=3155363 RepID=UPI0033EEBE96